MRPLVLLPVLVAFAAAAPPAVTPAPGVIALPFPAAASFVRSGDGTLWAADAAGVRHSRDEGASWALRPWVGAGPSTAHTESAFLRTREGVLLFAVGAGRESASPQSLWLVRSADDGRTWSPPRLLGGARSGAPRQLLQLRSGRVVLLGRAPPAGGGRPVAWVQTSDDLGLSWRDGGPLEPAAPGGGGEATAFERSRGDLKLFLRASDGAFLESTSRDGTAWPPPIPGPVEAGDAPGAALRLASGRIVLVWTRAPAAGGPSGPGAEVVLAFSGNDGATWSAARRIAGVLGSADATESGAPLADPQVFEPSPGVLWISPRPGGPILRVREHEFTAPAPGGAPRVLLLGDSITRGARPGVLAAETYGPRVRALLRAEGVAAEIHNSGIGGERTDQALARLERDVIALRPRVVTVMFGTNDSWVDRGQTASRLPRDAYAANLREIVRRLRAADCGVVLMTPPAFGDRNPRNGLGEDPNIRLALYAEAVRTVARELGVPLVDHHAAWTAAAAAGISVQAWTTDGCHPNAEGQDDLARRLLPALRAGLRAP